MKLNKIKVYAVKKFLNRKNSPSNGIVSVYHGPAHWNSEATEANISIEDCRNIIKLHMTELDTPKDFIKKLKLLRDVIDGFITFLEETYTNEKRS